MRQQKGNFFYRTFSQRVLFTVIALVVIALISVPLAKNVSKQYKINKEINDLKNEIGALENNNSQLKNLIKYMESDQFVDEKARLNLNYKKEGEQVVVIEKKEENKNISSGGVQLAGSSGTNDASKLESNFVKWQRYFFNN
jgi:cell division protein FtsB